MEPDAQKRPDRVVFGISLMVFSVFMMSIQDAIFKYYSAGLSLWQIFSLRRVLTLPILLALAWFYGNPIRAFRDSIRRWPLIRSLCLTLMFIFMYASSPFLSRRIA